VRHIDFDPSSLLGEQKDWWDNWFASVSPATERIINRWESSKKIDPKKDFESDIWSTLKQWYLKVVFNHKCAYCESDMEGEQSGHAEHYRPKAGVNYLKLGAKNRMTAKVADETGVEIKHPGYFWLAYDWKNLVPSCEKCNTSGGKANQFPVAEEHVMLRKLTLEEADALNNQLIPSKKWPGFFYPKHDLLNRLEQPQLLHPFDNERPEQHVRFTMKGIIAPIQDEKTGQVSTRGLHSITVYNLKRDGLERKRDEAQRNALTNYGMAHIEAVRKQLPPNESLAAAKAAVQEVLDGESEYSAAARDLLFEYHSILRHQENKNVPANPQMA
jgi:hypothetical protein